MYKILKEIILKLLPPGSVYRIEPPIRRAAALWYSGTRYFCPLCERWYRKFINLRGEEGSDLVCPGCGSIERKRLLWMFLQKELKIEQQEIRILHFSPHRFLSSKIKDIKALRYVTTDFESRKADRAYDITDIDEPSGSYDLVICYHVLEHIADDRKAMAELYRIIKPGGIALLQVPFTEFETVEDATVTDPQRRKILFGQEDHVRYYGRSDFADRLQRAGFAVEQRKYAGEIEADLAGSMALRKDEIIFVCRK